MFQFQSVNAIARRMQQDTVAGDGAFTERHMR